jgi:hypothetical protein
MYDKLGGMWDGICDLYESTIILFRDEAAHKDSLRPDLKPKFPNIKYV